MRWLFVFLFYFSSIFSTEIDFEKFQGFLNARIQDYEKNLDIYKEDDFIRYFCRGGIIAYKDVSWYLEQHTSSEDINYSEIHLK